MKSKDFVFKGFFKDDLKDGKGELEFESGEKFEGEFQAGQKHGPGKTIGINQII